MGTEAESDVAEAPMGLGPGKIPLGCLQRYLQKTGQGGKREGPKKVSPTAF